MKKVAKGIKHIHDQGYVHFDIKTSNILLNTDKSGKITDVKIADFGLTRILINEFTAGVDT